MAVTYSTAMKTARMTATRNAIDAGTGNGSIEIGTAAMALVLAVIPLSAECGTVSGAILTFDMPKSDTSADDDGTAAAAQIKDGDGTVVVSGLTVGTTGSDINLDSVSITTGQTVTLSSATITHAT